jgi:excinuclease UvrABC ATPase subunit
VTLSAQTVSQMVDHVMALPEGTKLMLLAPLIEGRKGEHLFILERLRTQGYIRARIDGMVVSLDEAPDLKKNFKHTIEAVVDRVVVHPGQEQRLAESFETAANLGEGLIRVVVLDEQNNSAQEIVFSARYARIAVTASPNSNRGCFRSTTRPGPAPAATASACASFSIPRASSATPRCRCRPERSVAGTGATHFISTCWNRWRSITSLILTRRSGSSRKRLAT